MIKIKKIIEKKFSTKKSIKNVLPIKKRFIIFINQNLLFLRILLVLYLFILLIVFNRKKVSLYLKKKKYMLINEQKELNINSFIKRLKELQRDSIKWPLSHELKLKPSMSDEELIGFSYFMRTKNIYFEFGSGGSTNLASYYKLNKIYSVESDIRWHNKIKNLNLIGIIFITIDLKAKENKFGTPGPGTTVIDWEKYIQAYKQEYNADIILIDGRFRVACCLDIFSKIKSNTLVLVHDYVNRKYYHIIEKYYIKIKSWGTLAAFFKNPNISYIPTEVYNKYKYIFN